MEPADRPKTRPVPGWPVEIVGPADESDQRDGADVATVSGVVSEVSQDIAVVLWYGRLGDVGRIDVPWSGLSTVKDQVGHASVALFVDRKRK